MIAQALGVAEAVRTRRSAGRLLDVAPQDEELHRLVGLAMNAPDHADLRPWRLALLRGEARSALGAALAEAAGDEAQRAKPLRAPLLIAIVFRPVPHPKVPEWEQLASASWVVANLGLLLHAEGWASVWRTGPHLGGEAVRAVLGLAAGERLLGFLYVGLPDADRSRGARPPRDATPHLTVLDIAPAQEGTP